MKKIIEAGHYYQVMGPSMSSLQGWELGKELAKEHEGSELVLFVDDYHDEQTFSEAGDSYFSDAQIDAIATRLMSEADHVFSESALAKLAPEAVTELLENGLVKLKKGVFSAAGVRLGQLRRPRHYLV